MKTHIGIYEWEQKITQTLEVDIEIATDKRNCQDKIENTLDYDAIAKKVTSYVENNSFALIETVAENIADLIIKSFAISQINICVSKPNAIKNAKNVSIKIFRTC